MRKIVILAHLFALGFVLSLAWSCSPTKQVARTAAGALVDCTTGALLKHDDALVQLVRTAIASGDWSPVRDSIRTYGVEAVGCTAADLVLQRPAMGIAAGADAREGFEGLRAQALDGRRFKVAEGRVL